MKSKFGLIKMEVMVEALKESLPFTTMAGPLASDNGPTKMAKYLGLDTELLKDPKQKSLWNNKCGAALKYLRKNSAVYGWTVHHTKVGRPTTKDRNRFFELPVEKDSSFDFRPHKHHAQNGVRSRIYTSEQQFKNMIAMWDGRALNDSSSIKRAYAGFVSGHLKLALQQAQYYHEAAESEVEAA